MSAGTPIGSSLCYFEKAWLSNCPIKFKPIPYYRYVDDTFITFKDESDMDLFLQTSIVNMPILSSLVRLNLKSAYFF